MPMECKKTKAMKMAYTTARVVVMVFASSDVYCECNSAISGCAVGLFSGVPFNRKMLLFEGAHMAYSYTVKIVGAQMRRHH